MVKAGDTFGRLTVLRCAGYSPNTHSKRWFVRCECGVEKAVDGSKLSSGNTKSCGCFRVERGYQRAYRRNIKRGKTMAFFSLGVMEEFDEMD